MTCAICYSYVDEFSAIGILYFFKRCGHEICSECIELDPIDTYPDILCPVPDCKCNLMESEIEDFYGPEAYRKMQIANLKKAFQDNEFFVICNCGQAIEVLPEENVNYNQKKDDGTEMSRKACENLSKYRVRCQSCKTDFCRSCEVAPYHQGYTCESYAEEILYDRCRFCNCHIDKGLKVCSDGPCMQKQREVCQFKQKCGHFCYGHNQCQVGDAKHPPCLNPICVKQNPKKTLEEDEDSFCTICYTEGLGEQPIVMLNCKHIFHKKCL
jgi:E3 ubiquitin-protein ligase MYCBP2